jgi:hypothetical protein
MNEIVKRKPYIKYIIAGVVCFLFLIIITLLIYILTRRKKGIPFYLTYGSHGNIGIWYSNDGMKWTNCSKESVTDIAYNGVDTFLAVGPEGNVFYSNDGKNWTLYASNIFGTGGTGGNQSIIAYNGVDTWVVGGYTTGGNNLAYSNDGKKWTPVTNIFGGGYVSSIVYNGVDTWVATGSGIGYSNDGKKWTPASSGIEGIFCPLAYNGVNTWIVLGTNGAAHSTDGQSWNPVPTIISGYDVEYNGVDTWVAVGMGSDYLSCIMYSKDNGKNWTQGTNNFSPSGSRGTFASMVTSVVYNGIDTWVAVGGGDKIPTTLYSKDDGLTWNKGTDIFSGDKGGYGSSVAYNGVDMWVASGIVNNRSVVAYSKDGINWTLGTGIDVQISNEDLRLKIFTLK